MKKRASNWATRNMPTRQQMADNRFLAPIAHRFLSPELWRFTRRSVPRGVALGLFCGFMIPVGQIFLAAFMALPARANVPLAALVTFITNPFTFPFWAYVANQVGTLILQIDPTTMGNTATDELASGRWSWLIEMFEGAGVTVLVTIFGFIVLAIVGAAIGYLVSGFIWRIWIGRKRKKQLVRLERRLDKRLKAKSP